MKQLYQALFDTVEQNKDLILEAERTIWKNPESGYREWKTHAYMKKQFEALGYTLCEAGDIPGFYTDIDTGRPGPKLAVFGEMDSLLIPSHPECDPETGAVHACGHHCQCAALLGLAIALKTPGVLDAMSGSIRLIAVPAEEGVEFEFRRGLREKGIIHFFSGKLEFLYRGYLDGVDLAMMVHASANDSFGCNGGSNGNIVKKAIFRGTAAHAGGSPHLGHNALYAANAALTAANALRETFREQDTIRFHPIITKGGASVNAIPDEVVVESYVRGATMDAIVDVSRRINRAFAGAAASMGCKVTFIDEHNHAPRKNDANMKQAFFEAASMLFPPEKISFSEKHGCGCSDMGDITAVMPGIHPYCGGSEGTSHSASYRIRDPYLSCVVNAKVQAGAVLRLMSDGAALAKKTVAEAKPTYASKEEFFQAIRDISYRGEGVVENEDGTLTLKFQA